jgi:Fe-S cluster assembly ATP-binding protein
MLAVRNIDLKKGGRRIINDVSFDVGDGEIYCILGANGAGKSSLAFALMGSPDYRPDHGTISFDGSDITGMDIDERARMGITLAWQEPARFEGLPVADYVMLGSRRQTGSHAAGCLERLQLAAGEYMGRQVDRTLSGGERKKVELAAVMAMRPRLAILDEPDSGIDIHSRQAVIDMIRGIRDYGGSVLLITHEEDTVAIADRAALMCSGTAFKVGEPREVIDYYHQRCRPCPSKEYPSPEDSP